MDPRAGKYLIDSIDFWVAYNMFVSDGVDNFLRYAKRKDSITHDWMDSNGIDVDLSRVFFQSREIPLEICFIAKKEDFLPKYTLFIAQWAKPWTHRLEITSLGQSFFVYYKECTAFTKYTKIENDLVMCKFTITVVEPEPNIDTSHTYIIDDIGRYIIT